jgi:hypothetical protein
MFGFGIRLHNKLGIKWREKFSYKDYIIRYEFREGDVYNFSIMVGEKYLSNKKFSEYDLKLMLHKEEVKRLKV